MLDEEVHEKYLEGIMTGGNPSKRMQEFNQNPIYKNIKSVDSIDSFGLPLYKKACDGFFKDAERDVRHSLSLSFFLSHTYWHHCTWFLIFFFLFIVSYKDARKAKE